MRESYEETVKRLAKPLGQPMDAIHAALGMVTEAGEIADAIKAHIIYGKPLDVVNIVEELGDLRFFMEMMIQQIGLNMHFIERGNVAKLNARYQQGYNDADAKERKKAFEMEELKRATWRG